LAFQTPLIGVLAVDPLDAINDAIKRAGRVAEAAAERAEQIAETRPRSSRTAADECPPLPAAASSSSPIL
jgi:hypothetical protein